ncbi:MAG: hypothetical protein SPE99_08090 [Blautia sp.]|nr:hypothetical protein [Blautia sp.]
MKRNGKKLLMAVSLLLMLLLAMSVTVNAASKAVATIGNKKYVSLEKALKAVKNNETIVLRANVNSAKNIIIDRRKKFVLDLNKKTISLSGDYIFQVRNGTVTLKNGYIKKKEGEFIIHVGQEGSLIVKTGKYTGAIYVSGKLQTYGAIYQPVEGANRCLVVDNTGKAVINKGTFSNNYANGCIMDNYGKVTINGGTFSAGTYCVWNYTGKVYIKGGSFRLLSGGAEENPAVIRNEGGTVNIYNGTLSSGTMRNARVAYNNKNMYIYGGTLKAAGNNDGILVDNGGKLYLKGGNILHSAKDSAAVMVEDGSFSMSGGTIRSKGCCAAEVHSGSVNLSAGKVSVNNTSVVNKCKGASAKVGRGVKITGLGEGFSVIQTLD